MNIKVAYYANVTNPGAGSLDIAWHDRKSRDRIVTEITRATGARFKLAMEEPLSALVKRGAVGPRTAEDWTQRCALRGACRAYGLA